MCEKKRNREISEENFSFFISVAWTSISFCNLYFFFSLNWSDHYSQLPVSAISTRANKQFVPTVVFVFCWHVYTSSNMQVHGCRICICICIHQWKAEMQARAVTFRPENSNRVTWPRVGANWAFPFFVYSALWFLFVWSLCLRVVIARMLSPICAGFHCSKRYWFQIFFWTCKILHIFLKYIVFFMSIKTAMKNLISISFFWLSSIEIQNLS